jgi:TPR repeat protein
MEPGHETHLRRCEEADYAYCCGKYEKAAAAYAELLREGCTVAAIALGEMYLRGKGVKVDLQKGLELLRRAAAAGESSAAFNLGALHRSGADGVPVDAAESRRYFLLARELGCILPVDDYLS